MAQIDQTEIEQSDNPYVGPRSFTTEEAHLYFGRDREARDLIALVISQRLVLFYAQSGAGKSSLINTKIIPGLQAEGYELLPVGRVSGHSPIIQDEGNIFAHNLMYSLHQQGDVEEMSLSHFLDNLVFTGGEYCFDEQYEYAENEELKPRALLIDQFEEIFTSHPEAWQQRDGFFEQLNQALEDDPDLIVLLSMREDFVARLSPFRHLLPDGLRTRYYMQRMMADDALKAIRGPVETEEINRPFAPGVAEKLVENLQLTRSLDQDGETVLVKGEYVEPVQLQVVCHQLWENLEHSDAREISMNDVNTLVHKALEQPVQAGSGGLDEGMMVADGASGQEEEIDPLAIFIDQALGDFYEQALARALSSSEAEIEEAFLREWFSKKLITESGSRGILNRGKDYTADVPDEIIKLLLEEYIIRSETRAGATWIELVHDRFVQPIREANQAWTERRIMATPWVGAAHRWKSNDEDEDLLLRDGLLEAALEEAGDLNQQPQLVKRFLQQSKQAQARKERDQARFRVAIIGAFAVIAVIGLIIIGFFLYQSDQANETLDETNDKLEVERDRASEERDRANEETIRANEQTLIANEETIRANEQTLIANEEKDRADKQTDIANSLRLMDLARRHLAEGNTSGALLASLEAYTISPTPDTQAMLLEALDRALEPHGSQPFTATKLDSQAIPGMQSLLSIALSPDGQFLVLGDAGGNLLVWDRLENQVHNELDKAHGNNDVFGLAWHPTKPIFASASGDLADDENGDELKHNILLWTLQDGIFESLPLAQDVGSVWDLAFSRDGNLLAAANYDGSITIWDLSGSEPVLINVLNGGHDDWVWALEFSPVDDRLISGGRDARVVLWPSPADEDVEPIGLEDHQAWVNDVVFSSDATLIAAVSDDNQVIVWDASTDTPERRLLFTHGEFQDEPPWAATFLPSNDRILVTAGRGDRLRYWDIESGELVFEDRESSTEYQKLIVDPQNPSTLVGISTSSKVPLFWDTPVSQRMLANPLAITLQEEGKLVPGWTGTELPLLSGGNILLWTAGAQVPISRTLPISESMIISGAAFSLEGSLLATASPGNMVTLWRLEPDGQAELLDSITGDDSEELSALIFNQDGTILAGAFCRPSAAEQAPGDPAGPDLPTTSGESKTGTDSLSEVQEPTSEAIDRISPVTCNSNLIRVWEIDPAGTLGANPQQIDVIDPHSITDLAFAPDASMYSSLLLLTDSNGDLSVINDLSSVIEPLRIATEDQDEVLRNTHITTIPDENYLVSAGCIARRIENQLSECLGGFVQFWDLASKEPLGPPLNIASNEIKDLEWLPETGNLTILDDDGRLTWWESDVNIWLELACLQAGRNMTFEEWSLAFPELEDVDSDYRDTCEEHGYGRHFTFAEINLEQGEAELRECQDEDTQIALTLFDRALDEANVTTEYTELDPSQWAAGILLQEATELMISSPANSPTARACLNQIQTLPDIEPPDVDDTMRVLSSLAQSHDQLRLDDYTNALDQAFSAFETYNQIDSQVMDLDQPLADIFADLCFKAPDDDAERKACGELTSLLPEITSDEAQRSTTNETPLWFFTGEAGDLVTIDLTGASPSYDPDLILRDSDGAVIDSNNDSGKGYNGYNAEIFKHFIQKNGIYFIQAGQPDNIEQYTLNFSTIKPAPIVSDQLRRTTTGVQSLWTFEGHAGDILNIEMKTDEAIFDLFMTLLNSEGQYLTESYGGGGDLGVLITDYLITEDGDYYITTNLADSNAAYELLLTRSDPAPLVAGQPENSTTIDNAMWVFSGNAGDVVTLELIGSNDFYDPFLYLLDAGGVELAANDDSGEGFFGYDSRIDGFVLPAAGDYLVRAGRPDSTEPYTLTLTVAQPQPLSLPARQDLSAGHSWSFPATQGQTMRIAIDEELFAGSLLTLVNPDGTLAIEQTPGILTTLDTTGTYIVAIQSAIDPEFEFLIDEEVAAEDAPFDAGLSFLIVEEVASTPTNLGYDSTDDGQLDGFEADYWTFDGSVGQPVEIRVAAENDDIKVTLYGPDGEQMGQDSGRDRAELIKNIPIDGPYVIVVHGAGEEASGDYTITLAKLDSVPIPQACGMDEASIDYGPIDIGSLVLLGRHRPVDGDDNWAEPMIHYVGLEAEVIDLGGLNDNSACPVVYVDVDGGEFVWRIRDMILLEP